MDKNADVEKDDEVFVEEQVVVPTFLANLPIFDEYNIDFIELPNLYALLESDSFQESNDNIHPIRHNYNMVQKESSEFTRGESLPLCFSSFNLLKGNFNIKNQAWEFGFMENHIEFVE